MCIFVLFSFRQTKHHSPNFIFYNTKPQGNKQGKGSYITCANYHVHLFVLISFKQKKLSPNFIFTTLSLKGKNKEKEVTSHVVTTMSIHLFWFLSNKKNLVLIPNFIFTTLSLKGKNKEKEVTSHVVTTMSIFLFWFLSNKKTRKYLFSMNNKNIFILFSFKFKQ